MTTLHHVTWTTKTPFLSGPTSVTEGVPGRWDVALAGRGYMLDLASGEFQHRTVALLKQDIGADVSEPGEAAINPEGPWRRSWSTWHLGAGQEHADLADSTRERFRASKGVNVWNRGELTLLPDTELAHVHAGATAQMAEMGGVLYYLDGEDVIATDLDSATTCDGTPSENALSIAASGSAVYVAYGSSGVYRATATTFSQFTSADSNLVAWVKGRILSAAGGLLEDLSTGTPETVLNHADANFEWAALAEGVGYIFAAGNSGSRALIYRIGITADGSSLDAPVVAGRLPDGEMVHAMVGYLGVLIIGTSRGFRLAAEDPSGAITIGNLVDLGRPVRVFTARGDSVWFGWSDYDGESTGVGRINLGVPFTATLVPAYASDLMVEGQGAVDGLAFVDDALAIGVPGVGIHRPAATTVDSGWVDLGRVTYGLSEEKTIVGARVDAAGGAALFAGPDGRTLVRINETDEAERGRWFDVRLVIDAGATVRMATLYAYPAPQRVWTITWPLLVHETVTPANGAPVHLDVNAIVDEIEQMVETQRIVIAQQGRRRYRVKVEDVVWVPRNRTADGSAWNQTGVVRLKRIPGRAT